MSKSEIMTTDTGKAGEPDALTDKELDAVAGGNPTTAATIQAMVFNFQYHGVRFPPPAPDPN